MASCSLFSFAAVNSRGSCVVPLVGHVISAHEIDHARDAFLADYAAVLADTPNEDDEVWYWVGGRRRLADQRRIEGIAAVFVRDTGVDLETLVRRSSVDVMRQDPALRAAVLNYLQDNLQRSGKR